MKHREFIRVFAHDLGTSQEQANRILETFLGAFYLGLARDGLLEIRGLGRFKVTESRAQTLRSGLTGEMTFCPGSKRTSFSMAMPLRRALRGESE